MPSYLITGCSRGLGLELVKSLVDRKAPSADDTIFASSRSEAPSEQLQDIIKRASERVKYVQLDTEDAKSIQSAASHMEKELGEAGLDVLINNAGVQYAEPGGAREMHSLQKTLTTNVVAVHHVTAAFLPLLQKGQQKKIINISSTLGSIGMKDIFAMAPVSSYKISKTALNMLTVQYSVDLAGEGFTVVAVSPGWLKTDLGGPYADLTPTQGAVATLDLIEKLTPSDNGSYKNIDISGHDSYNGETIPW